MDGFRFGFHRGVVVLLDAGFQCLAQALHDAVQRLQPVETFFHGLRQGVVGGRGAGEIGVAEHAAADHRHFQRAQRGDGVRIGQIGAIGVPEYARIVAANVLAVLLDIGDHENFRMINVELVGEFQFAQLAEARAEADMVFIAERLPAEINDFVPVEGVADLRERGVVKRPRQVGADDFRAERGAAGFYLNGHSAFPLMTW